MVYESWSHDLQLSKYKLHKSAFHFFKFLSKSYEKTGKIRYLCFVSSPKIPHRVFYL